MDSTVDHVPATRDTFRLHDDILFGVFQHLSSRDIKSIRQVSKCFNLCGSPYLVRSVYFSGHRRDQEVLKSISEHPVFAKHVTELVYNISIFDKNMTTDEFKSHYGNLLRNQLYRNKVFDLELSEGALAASYKQYIDFYQELRHSMEASSTIACLATALSRLSNLQKFRVVTGWKNDCGDEGGPSGRSWDITVLNPNIYVMKETHSWYVRSRFEHERRWLAFFLKIVGTIATKSTKQPLLSLDMDVVGYRVPLQALGFFDLSPENLNHWQVAFCHLKRLDLSMYYSTESCLSNYPEQDGSLGNLLKSAPNLEILRLRFEFEMQHPESLTQILGSSSFTWGRLRHFRIAGLFLSIQSVLDFIENHAQTLRHIELDEITLADGSWANLLDQVKTWHDESVVQLDDCWIDRPAFYDLAFGEYLARHSTIWEQSFEERAVSRESIKGFLYGNAQNPFNDPTLIDENERLSRIRGLGSTSYDWSKRFLCMLIHS